MFVVIIVSLLALFLTYLENKGLKGGMKWGFVLVAILNAIHYDYGNDYMSYYKMYMEIEDTPFSWDVLSNSIIHQDGGWVFLNYLFKPLGGFFLLVIVLSIIQNIIVYKFIKREVSSSHRTFAVFIYLMTTSFYLMSFSMLRQWFVVCIFLSCWSLIKERKWFWTLLILYLCSFIHGTAILLLPFAFWGYVPVRHGKLVVTFIIGLFVVLLISNDVLYGILSVLQNSGEFDLYFERYENATSELEFGVGFIMQLIPLFVTFWYLWTNKGAEADKSLVFLSSIGFVIICFMPIIPLLGRVSTYFSIFTIASIPLMYSTINNRVVKYGLIAIIILLTTYDYILFFSNPVWIKDYSTFKTIFYTF